jgi:hypothetical protein
VFCVVPRGGYLFEHFLRTYGPERLSSRWTQIKKPRSAAQVEASADIKIDDIVNEFGTRFYGYIMMALQNLEGDGKDQMFLATYSAKFYGLSPTGIDIQAKLGFTMPQSSFKEAMKDDFFNSKAQLRYKNANNFLIPLQAADSIAFVFVASGTSVMEVTRCASKTSGTSTRTDKSERSPPSPVAPGRNLDT